jgi:hypothetical protein
MEFLGKARYVRTTWLILSLEMYREMEQRCYSLIFFIDYFEYILYFLSINIYVIIIIS